MGRWNGGTKVGLGSGLSVGLSSASNGIRDGTEIGNAIVRESLHNRRAWHPKVKEERS